MKILGIGNAIIDVICKIDDNFLNTNGLTKSTMKLVDEIEFNKLIKNLKLKRLFLVDQWPTLSLDSLNLVMK